MKPGWRDPIPNLKDPPPCSFDKYFGYQKMINTEDGFVNQEKLEEHVAMIKQKGWLEISPITFEILPLGCQIRYVTTEGKFRTGGFVVAVDYDNDPPQWLSYLSHTQSTWSLQLEDTQRLFYLTRDKLKRKDQLLVPGEIVMFRQPRSPPCQYDVYLNDVHGVPRRVYGCKSKIWNTRFLNTNAYRYAILYGWKFLGEEEVNPPSTAVQLPEPKTIVKKLGTRKRKNKNDDVQDDII